MHENNHEVLQVWGLWSDEIISYLAGFNRAHHLSRIYEGVALLILPFLLENFPAASLIIYLSPKKKRDDALALVLQGIEGQKPVYMYVEAKLKGRKRRREGGWAWRREGEWGTRLRTTLPSSLGSFLALFSLGWHQKKRKAEQVSLWQSTPKN